MLESLKIPGEEELLAAKPGQAIALTGVNTTLAAVLACRAAEAGRRVLLVAENDLKASRTADDTRQLGEAAERLTDFFFVGTVVLAGYGRGRVMSLRMDDIHIPNLRVLGAGNNWNMHRRAIALMSEGMIDLKSLISHRIRPEEFEEGIELARTRPEGFVKAVFVHE